MALKTLQFNPALIDYLVQIAEPEHPALEGLRRATDELEHSDMQSAPLQMALIAILLKLTGARRVLEIGCFTGYGSLAMALAMTMTKGHVTTLDVNEPWAAIGRRYWHEAGVDHRIEFIQGLAIESLGDLVAAGRLFDFIYVDADKKSYPAYLDAALRLLAPGGLIALDNMLWGGAVADPENRTRQVLALRQVAQRLRDDKDLTSCLLPIGDGLMLARKES